MLVERKGILEARIGKNDVPKVYAKIAPKYDTWGNLAESKARSRCLELANIQNGEAVLEVAVGTGLAFAEIIKANPEGRNEGIDLTEEMLDRARRRVEKSGMKNYRLELGDAYKLEFQCNAFDVLINNYMFDLLPEDDFPTVLAEFKRVLRPGGRVVLVNMAKAEHWYNYIWEIIYRISPASLGGCRGVYLMPYLKSIGFNQAKREFISQMTFPSEVVYGIKL
ncbi:MAG: methyltransferase domain-containing protein [Deltaproteobacteria bacterium]|nr:MAG: methyltransferase domain-containing protein [Deltaproteobacteria bacterium]